MCAVAVLLCGLTTVLSCSSTDTSSIEPTTSTQTKDGTTPTSYSQADPVPSGDMTEIWKKMGFTTEQAECLNDKMKDLSTKIDPNDPTGSLAANQTLIQGLMDECKINEATLTP